MSANPYQSPTTEPESPKQVPRSPWRVHAGGVALSVIPLWFIATITRKVPSGEFVVVLPPNHLTIAVGFYALSLLLLGGVFSYSCIKTRRSLALGYLVIPIGCFGYVLSRSLTD